MRRTSLTGKGRPSGKAGNGRRQWRNGVEYTAAIAPGIRNQRPIPQRPVTDKDDVILAGEGHGSKCGFRTPHNRLGAFRADAGLNRIRKCG